MKELQRVFNDFLNSILKRASPGPLVCIFWVDHGPVVLWQFPRTPEDGSCVGRQTGAHNHFRLQIRTPGHQWQAFPSLRCHSQSSQLIQFSTPKSDIVWNLVRQYYLLFTCRPRWSRGNVLVLRSKVRGFKTDWGRWFFSRRKNPEHKSSGRDFKLGDPSLRF